MEVDIKLLITLGGMLASVVSAAAITRQQIRHIEEELKELKGPIDAVDIRMDRNDMTTGIVEQRLDVIVGMNSPDKKERMARELEGFKKDIEFLRGKVS